MTSQSVPLPTPLLLSLTPCPSQALSKPALHDSLVTLGQYSSSLFIVTAPLLLPLQTLSFHHVNSWVSVQSSFSKKDKTGLAKVTGGWVTLY
jgi:hypothetical protein